MALNSEEEKSLKLSRGQTDPDEEDEDGEEDEGPPTITQRVIGWLWFFFKLSFAITIISLIVIIGALVGVVKGFSEQIPIITDKSYRPNLTTQLFDAKGRLLAKLHAEENRTRILASSEICNSMKQAVVAIEDERFYQHYGIDLEGILRAVIKNIQAGKVVQGASTLTQQLVKNAFLNSEKSLKRKAIEAMLAFQLERKYSKEEILTLYLNEIYFGHGNYGIDAASHYYFNKEAKDLTLIECATLAGIPKSPVFYSPYKYPENNKNRRELVLSKMVELGFISPAEYQEAIKQTVKLSRESNEAFLAPYFVTYVRDILLEKYGANLVYNGGLKVFTTIDLDMQKYAEEAMENSETFRKRPLKKTTVTENGKKVTYEADPNLNGALICIDPHNGHIKAMYGGRSFDQSQFNRVTQAYRQPGSSFKPIVYGCALENGSLPGDMIVDEPISYTNPWTHRVWSPKNYDLKFHGVVTLIKALQNSFNIPAVRLFDKLTPAKVIRFARRLGVTSPMQPNLSLALGSGNFTPLEMAGVYGVFANQGIHVSPIGIIKIEDRDGNLIEEVQPQAKEVMKASHAAMLTDMLRNAVEKGTGKKAAIKGHVVAGKTGTTNDYVDAWFDGFTPEYVAVVQFGYDRPKSLGAKQAGGTVAAPVWYDFMSKVVANLPYRDFPVPEGCARIPFCIASGKPAVNSCPRELVAPMVYPLEFIPKLACPTHSGGAKFALETEEGVEFADDHEATLAYAQAVEETDEFFKSDYTQENANKKVDGKTNVVSKPAVIIENSDDDPGKETNPHVKTGTILDSDTPASDDDGMDAVVYGGADQKASKNSKKEPSSEGKSANDLNNEVREPGVVMKPKVEFRENFQ
ncbi:MAG: penicillin-binding protein 1A [Candidatus Riflebacteria bacterium]|nr:penicillin-binding protein 1A [Candidatus Riflebacteria bacterium]